MRALSTRNAQPMLARGHPERTRARQAGAWRKFTRSRIARRLAWPALGVVAALGIGVGVWTWHTGIVGQIPARAAQWIAAVSVEAGLSVAEVTITGRRAVGREDILGILAVHRGDPILLFDVEAARVRLESVGWIESATVSRQLPATIRVVLVERRPFALWQNEGVVTLIDRAGATIADEALGEFSHLPLLVGADAAGHAGALMDALAGAPALLARVAVAIRIGGWRWDVRLDNGVAVRLPAEGAAAAWARLAKLARRDDLLERDIISIDLRLADRLIVRLAPGAASRRRDPGESA